MLKTQEGHIVGEDPVGCIDVSVGTLCLRHERVVDPVRCIDVSVGTL